MKSIFFGPEEPDAPAGLPLLLTQAEAISPSATSTASTTRGLNLSIILLTSSRGFFFRGRMCRGAGPRRRHGPVLTAAATPRQQAHRKHVDGGRGSAIGDPGEDLVHGHAPYLPDRLGHGGQAWQRVVELGDTVEADHGHIVGDAQ